LLSVYESEDTRKQKSKLFMHDKNRELFLKKINLLTVSKRPFCTFCKAICGFSWFKATDFILCKHCHEDESTQEIREKNSFVK